MNKTILAVTGLPGSGKTKVTQTIESMGFVRVRFGDITDDALRAQGLERNETNERLIREGLRKKYGMAAYAILSMPRIHNAFAINNVVLDGLYSWEEYLVLCKEFPNLILIAVHAPPRIRYKRLINRPERPLTEQEVKSRENSEIEVLNKGGTIAMADIIIENTGTLQELEEKTKKIANTLLQKDNLA